MRHVERGWHERVTFDPEAAYAGSGFSTRPVNARLTSPAACKRNVYLGNAAGKSLCRGAASKRPSSARSSSNTQALVRHCSAAGRDASSPAYERRCSATGAWDENNGFSPEFRRRREDIARRGRAMITRGVGLRGTGATDFEALDDENQRLKQALNKAAEENRRCRVYSTRLEEELLRSDRKVEVLLAELEQAPSMRNQRLVSDARCEIDKCAVVRTLVKQRRDLQQILVVRNREIENLKRKQESSALAEMTAAAEEYYLETQRLSNLLARQQLGLSSFPVSPNEQCAGGSGYASTQLEKPLSEGDDGLRPAFQNSRDFVNNDWAQPAELIDRWNWTYSPLNRTERHHLQSQGMSARLRRTEGWDGGDVYTKNPVQTQHRGVRAATDPAVAQEILDTGVCDEFERSALRRRDRPVSPVARRYPPRAAQMAPRTERGMSSRNRISPRQRKTVTKSHLSQRSNRQGVIAKRCPSSRNLAAEGGFSVDDAVRDVATMARVTVREKTNGHFRTRPLSAPSRRRDVGESSLQSKKAKRPWGRSSNRTLSPCTGGNTNESTGISNSAPIARAANVGRMMNPKLGKESLIDLESKEIIAHGGEYQDSVQYRDCDMSDRADANATLRSVSNSSIRSDVSYIASPAGGEIYSGVPGRDSKKGEENVGRGSISAERVRMQARKVGIEKEDEDSDKAGSSHDKNYVQKGFSSKRCTITSGDLAEASRAPLAPGGDSVDSRKRQPSPSHDSRKLDTCSRGGLQPSGGSDDLPSVPEGPPYTASLGDTILQHGINIRSGDVGDEIQSASSLRSQGQQERATSGNGGSRASGASVLDRESISVNSRHNEPDGQAFRVESMVSADKSSSVATRKRIYKMNSKEDIVGSAFEIVANVDDEGMRKNYDLEVGMDEDNVVATPDSERSSNRSLVDDDVQDTAFPVPSPGQEDCEELGQGDGGESKDSASQPSLSGELFFAASDMALPSSTLSKKIEEEEDFKHHDAVSTVGRDEQQTPSAHERTFGDGADDSLSATDFVGPRRTPVVPEGGNILIESTRRTELSNGENPAFEGGNDSGTARGRSYSGVGASFSSSIEQSDEIPDDANTDEAASITATKEEEGARSQNTRNENSDDVARSDVGGDEYGDDFE